jgi:coproporphyrinogen III oxidase-like Fe-S oxidoreductase
MARMEAGLDHYEISNFGKPATILATTRAIGKAHPTWGSGLRPIPSMGNVRRWNIANNAVYVKARVKESASYWE